MNQKSTSIGRDTRVILSTLENTQAKDQQRKHTRTTQIRLLTQGITPMWSTNPWSQTQSSKSTRTKAPLQKRR
ncbi:hypothetical protein F2Q68_00011453 [Brassica cretica]|uniref:Uncharacterized protein n=1 Tax=Brassica cretica TaxID=69181 RepID=A0A8S9L1S3_BRACR|nr:hypothetical protein F2Q68_00011453 [Brassica cretica]